MSQKILGIDLGTNSLGLALRDPDISGNIIDQLEYYTSIIFQSGVGTGKSGEYSFAAERRKYRSTRRLYQARKYRIWATLRLLIDHGCCPLSNEDLDRWSRYEKAKGLKRQYPIDAVRFEQWVRLDFNGDGKPDYSSPYQLRAELMEKLLNWDNENDRYKFGRAMYHIAQRRGFKSSKGETLKDAKESEDLSSIEISSAIKKSEEKKSKDLKEYMEFHHLKTVGCAFALLENEGIRVRNSEYQAVQSQYLDEIKEICIFQHIKEIDPDLYLRLTSTKQNVGTIFYRRPLRSQKGHVGKCTLEPTKRRCPISHPDFEEFRALSFINNIKFRLEPKGEWQTLSDEERTFLFDDCFTRTKSTFKFEDIRKWLEKKYPGNNFNYSNHTINYQDHTTVAGCPVTCRLKKIIGDDWHTHTITTDKTRTNYRTGEIHSIEYTYEDIWHLAYTSDDYEELAEFAKAKMNLDTKQVGDLTRLWSAIQEGYTSLSLKAIRNILPFLREGIIYSKAVALAKIPEIIGSNKWKEYRPTIMNELDKHSTMNEHLRLIYGITNTLIANHKSLTIDSQYGYDNTDYKLDNKDKESVQKCILDTLSEKRWTKLDATEQTKIQQEVEDLYQHFFATTERDYYKLPRQSDAIKSLLSSMFPDIQEDKWNSLYHHSQISVFPHQYPQKIEVDGRTMYVPQLGTPDIGSIKNPVALRALHVLRRAINQLILQGMVDEDTRVVVETARDMNDANWRKAIERYQNERKKENDAIVAIIKEFRPNYSDDDIEKGRLLFEQTETGNNDSNELNAIAKATKKEKEKAVRFALDMQKYKLWKEQKFRCLYTGKNISLTELFANNKFDIEHTIPRSISFDNSLKNRTVCETHFNRFKKENRIPTELSNYDEIKDRIKPWEEKVSHIKTQIELWKGNAKSAPTAERKNECLQQKHMWELELDYWQAKVHTFTVQKDELNLGFRNSQLVDTRIITKYAFHYLKSVFTRVDVQKGSVTADFRKILGIQSVDEKKDREKHSHHAIDATILTMIPIAAKRDRMIELFYQGQEAPDAEKSVYRMKLDKEIESCHLGNVNNLVSTIEQTILVNHITKDNTLSPSRKPRRIGKHRIKGQWLQGDSIRGSLHKETYYGAISDGDHNRLVVHKPLKSLSEKDLESIVDPALRKAIESQVRQYMAELNLSFAKAIEEPIYMTDKNGTPIKKDKNGHPLSPIRHVRCFAKAGRGELKYDTVLKIKQQTYLSKHNYKNTYYVQNDDNYLCLLYEGTVKGKHRREFRLINYFEIAQLHPYDINTFFAEPEFSSFYGNPSMPLTAIIKKGTRVLLYKNIPEEIKDLDSEKLSKRLYIVYKFNVIGTPNIYLKHHLEAQKETERNTPDSYLSLKANNFKALIEHHDFEVDPLGNITFK
jgi:CRISPR-associated endonuclease Csn1